MSPASFTPLPLRSVTEVASNSADTAEVSSSSTVFRLVALIAAPGCWPSTDGTAPLAVTELVTEPRVKSAPRSSYQPVQVSFVPASIVVDPGMHDRDRGVRVSGSTVASRATSDTLRLPVLRTSTVYSTSSPMSSCSVELLSTTTAVVVTSSALASTITRPFPSCAAPW